MVHSINKLEIGSLTLKRYADIDYDEWYALAEFVDNSLHSYMNNKSALNKMGVKYCDVKLSILDNGDGEEINILDNASGIHTDEFQRLLSLGVPKEKSDTQLSEFGMGMKTATIWFGNLIEIETKHYLQEKCYKITIDIDNVDTEDYVKIIEVKPSSNKKSYTKIKISKLNRKLNRKKAKIKESLSSIYRKYIESGDLVITFEDDVLKPFNIEFRKDAEGKPFKKEFEIKLNNGKKCRGWIGIMVKGKTMVSGFSVYRYSRMVQGYPENAWRPKEVYGSEGGSNSTKNQRLIGELDMSDFDVAHTKNKINFKDDDESEFRKQLKEKCADIASESDKTLKSRTVKEHEGTINVQIGKEKIDEYFKKPVNIDVSTIEYIAPAIKSKTSEKIKEIYENEDCQHDFSYMKDIEGIDKEIFIYHFMDSNLPYMIMDTIDEKLIVCININHPYYSEISDNGTVEKEMDFKINCIFDALAETHNLKKFGKPSPEDARLTKDIFLKRWVSSLVS